MTLCSLSLEMTGKIKGKYAHPLDIFKWQLCVFLKVLKQDIFLISKNRGINPNWSVKIGALFLTDNTLSSLLSRNINITNRNFRNFYLNTRQSFEGINLLSRHLGIKFSLKFLLLRNFWFFWSHTQLLLRA